MSNGEDSVLMPGMIPSAQQSGGQHGLSNCNCSRRGRICICVPRQNIDPMMIHVINESRRLRVLHELRTEMDKDLFGVDIKWVIFGMAVQNYRFKQLVVPCPPPYRLPNGVNIDALSFMVGTMTDMMEFQRCLLEKVLPPEQVELLHWLLIQSGTPRLVYMPRNEHFVLWRHLKCQPDPQPHMIFRVVPRGCEEMPMHPPDVTKYIYYSGDMVELHSLINAENYDISSSELEFFDDLELACGMAEWSPGWGHSICGSLLRCVAVCQVEPGQVMPRQKKLELRSSLKKLSPKKLGLKKPMQQEPMQQEPMQQEPMQQEPMQQEPMQQEPMQQEPMQQEPMQQEPRQQEPRQQEPKQPGLFQVRYLLIYSMSYSQKMERVRRRQWKKIQQRQLNNQPRQQDLEEPVPPLEREQSLEQQERDLEKERSQPGPDRHEEAGDQQLAADRPIIPTPGWLFTSRIPLLAVSALAAVSLILLAVNVGGRQ